MGDACKSLDIISINLNSMICIQIKWSLIYCETRTCSLELFTCRSLLLDMRCLAVAVVSSEWTFLLMEARNGSKLRDIRRICRTLLMMISTVKSGHGFYSRPSSMFPRIARSLRKQYEYTYTALVLLFANFLVISMIGLLIPILSCSNSGSRSAKSYFI